MKIVGLVGGISWVSTLDYYRSINEGVNEKLGGLNFAECIIYSLNFADIQEKNWIHSFDLLHKACSRLKETGVDAIVLCANSAHFFADKLQEEFDVPLISIVTETANAVQKKGINKVGLLGTTFTMEMSFYKEKLEAHHLEVLIPDEQEVRDYIQHTIKEELGRGIILSGTKQKYISIINDLVAKGAEGIILGCTELPMLISQTDVPVPVFDTTNIHSNAIVDFVFS